MFFFKSLHLGCRLLLVFALFAITFSCETPLNEVETIETETQASTQPPQTLADIEVNSIGGVPAFKNAEHFLAATRLLGSLNDDELLQWYSNNGLSAYFENYIDVNKVIEAEPTTILKDVLDKKDQRLFHLPEDGGVFILPELLSVSRVIGVNRDLYIGDIYHLFKEGKHYSTAGDDETLQGYLISGEQPGPETYAIDEMPTNFEYGSDGEKVQTETFNCPKLLASSNSNTNITRMDEQRIGCSKKSCRQRTWGTYQALSLQNGSQTLNLITYTFMNKRRSGWNWIRTFPNVFVTTTDNSSTSIAGVSIEPSCEFDQTWGEGARNQTFNGSAEATMNVYDIVEDAVVCSITQTSGRTQHTWTNRGDLNDPMQVRIGCQ